MLYHFVVSNRVEALFQRWRLAALSRHLYWWYWFSPNLKNWFILLSLKREKKNGKDILSMPKTHMYFQKKNYRVNFLTHRCPLYIFFYVVLTENWTVKFWGVCRNSYGFVLCMCCFMKIEVHVTKSVWYFLVSFVDVLLPIYLFSHLLVSQCLISWNVEMSI